MIDLIHIGKVDMAVGVTNPDVILPPHLIKNLTVVRGKDQIKKSNNNNHRKNLLQSATNSAKPRTAYYRSPLFTIRIAAPTNSVSL